MPGAAGQAVGPPAAHPSDGRVHGTRGRGAPSASFPAPERDRGPDCFRLSWCGHGVGQPLVLGRRGCGQSGYRSDFVAEDASFTGGCHRSHRYRGNHWAGVLCGVLRYCRMHPRRVWDSRVTAPRSDVPNLLDLTRKGSCQSLTADSVASGPSGRRLRCRRTKPTSLEHPRPRPSRRT